MGKDGLKRGGRGGGGRGVVGVTKLLKEIVNGCSEVGCVQILVELYLTFLMKMGLYWVGNYREVSWNL